MRRPRRNHSAAFKAKAAIAALKGDQTLAQSAGRFDVHANRITQSKTELLQRAGEMFATAARSSPGSPESATIGMVKIACTPQTHRTDIAYQRHCHSPLQEPAL